MALYQKSTRYTYMLVSLQNLAKGSAKQRKDIPQRQTVNRDSTNADCAYKTGSSAPMMSPTEKAPMEKKHQTAHAQEKEEAFFEISDHPSFFGRGCKALSYNHV